MPRSLKILIVEDSPAMRQLLALAVKKRSGVQVEEAADGLAALKALATDAVRSRCSSISTCRCSTA